MKTLSAIVMLLLLCGCEDRISEDSIPNQNSVTTTVSPRSGAINNNPANTPITPATDSSTKASTKTIVPLQKFTVPAKSLNLTGGVGAEVASKELLAQLPDQPFHGASAKNEVDTAEVGALISEIPHTTSGSVDSGNNGSDGNKPVMPEEVAKVLEKARDEKSITDAVNSAFKEAAQMASNSDSGVVPESNISVASPSISADSLGSSNSSAPSDRINPGVRSTKPNSGGGEIKFGGGFDFSGGSNTTPDSETPILSPVSGQARGYSMFYAMHPRARQTVELQIDALIRANIKEVYLGVLTDGTFGKDYNYLKSLLTRLADQGRVISLTLYLTNGPTMRIADQSPITAGFNTIDPIEFRQLIKTDSPTRAKFRAMVREVEPVFTHNKGLNPLNKNFAVVMLEDNLDRESYKAMREIAQDILGGLVQFIRNPCLSCFAGNDGDSLGDPIELHTNEDTGSLGSGDALSFDGRQFLYPGESNVGITFEEATSMAITAKEKNLAYFGLWRSDWQGLQGGPLTHPNDRNYAVPTTEQLNYDITLLRYGLE